MNPTSSFVEKEIFAILFPKTKKATLVPAFAGQHALFLVVESGRRHLCWADSPLQTEYRRPFSHFEPDFDDLMIFDACRLYSFYGFLNASSTSFSPLKFHQSHVCPKQLLLQGRDAKALWASPSGVAAHPQAKEFRELHDTNVPLNPLDASIYASMCNSRTSFTDRRLWKLEVHMKSHEHLWTC